MAATKALAAFQTQIGQARDLLGHVIHVVQRHGFGRILDQTVDILGDTVGGTLSVVTILVVLFAQVGSLRFTSSSKKARAASTMRSAIQPAISPRGR